MLDSERRALYNTLRMNWLDDPSIEVAPWQVRDYRSEEMDALFGELARLRLPLDRASFLAYAQEVDTPENLTEEFVQGKVCANQEEEDQIYLLVFELWRRLVPEKISLSVFCDELDYLISIYNEGDALTDEPIQDALSNLEIILEENMDTGGKPEELFASVRSCLANDLEVFLYDYIADQVDADQTEYAQSLLEVFSRYLPNNPWIDLLRVRTEKDGPSSHKRLKHVIQRAVKENDLQLNFEVLSTLIHLGDKREFNRMIRRSIPLLNVEEDFIDLLDLCRDYYSCLDLEKEESKVKKIVESRLGKSFSDPVDVQDPDVQCLLKIL